MKSRVSMLMLNGKAFGAELNSGRKSRKQHDEGKGPLLFITVKAYSGGAARGPDLSAEESHGPRPSRDP